jgi:hypothetical protein
MLLVLIIWLICMFNLISLSFIISKLHKVLSILRENFMEVPKKIKNRITIWYSYVTSGYIFKGKEISIWRDICTALLNKQLYNIELFTIDMMWKYPKCPSMDENFVFDSTGVWTLGLMLIRLAVQVLYHLSHFTIPNLCWVFFKIESHERFAKALSSWSLVSE